MAWAGEFVRIFRGQVIGDMVDEGTMVAWFAPAIETGRDAGRRPSEGAREHLAWLMWCFQEGYTNPADREYLDNWLLDDPSTLHPKDAELRPHLLTMADEVLARL